MELTKFGFAVGFILMIFPSTLFLLKSPPNQISLLGQWTWKYTEFSSKQIHRQSFAISPNLTSCHKSYGREDLIVYCCPPPTELSETIVDFEFPDDSSPTRVRRAAHLLDDEYLTKYARAVNIMKSLPEDDPRNFMRQANLHCLFCTASYNQQNFDPLPVHIHESWLFFPWHRMMLYFHEQILGSLIGDETFALPFWTWDIPEGMQAPNWSLNDPFTDPERDISHFPPRVVDLDFNDSESGLSPEDQIKNNLAVMYRQMVSGMHGLGAKKMELFMGCPFKAGDNGYCEGLGTIEDAPHNTVHRWVGSNLRVPGREDMGVFYSAARDPLFYAHHANIDRLFDVWRDHHQDIKIDDPDFLDSNFFFHDENLRFVRIRVRDVLDSSKLKYSYEKVETPWINSRPKPSVPVKIAREVLKMRKSLQDFKKPLELVSDLTIKVMRPRIQRSEKEKRREEEVLVVQGIDIKEDEFVKFDVYINFVGDEFVGPSCSEYAGTFVHVPSGVRHGSEENAKRKKSELKLGISELLQDLEAEKDDSILVTLVSRSPSCINVTVDGLMIEFMR